MNSGANQKEFTGQPALDPITVIKGIAGGAIGGALGCVLFIVLQNRFGLYALVVPGLFAGLGCSLLAKSNSYLFSVIGGISALIAAVVGEYQTAAFLDENGENLGFVFFLTHIHQSNGGMTLIAILLSTAAGAWLGRRAF